MDGITDTPLQFVPYHDPYDFDKVPDILSFINDPSDPTLDALFDVGGRVVPSSTPHQYSLPHFDDGIQDVSMTPVWDSGNDYNGGVNNFVPIPVLADHPPQSTGGEGEPGFNQNPVLGFGSNVMPPPVWTPPPNSFSCCGCQVLRQIVHINHNYILTLEIHGRLGSICHAIQETRANCLYDSNASSEPHYKNFDFCNKVIEEVKQFLTQYILERKVEGFIIQQDSLQAFYQTLCVGMGGEWDDILDYQDEFISEDFDTADDFISPNLERADQMEQPANEASGVTRAQGPRLPRFSLSEQIASSSLGRTDQMEQPANEASEVRRAQGPRLPRYSLAEQRERAANMTLDDLRAYFHLTIEKASEHLRFCPTVVKKICRRFGVNRWPARKIKSLEKEISNLRPLLNSDSTSVHVAAKINRLEREVARLVNPLPIRSN